MIGTTLQIVGESLCEALDLEARLVREEIELAKRIEKGQTIEGTIVAIGPEVAFVDVGGVDGLVHVTEISRRRVAPDLTVSRRWQPTSWQRSRAALS